MKRLLMVYGWLVTALTVWADDQRVVEAYRISHSVSIKLDGSLDEAAWSEAVPLTRFTAFEPRPGVACDQRTEVFLLYNDEGIYVGAHMWDEAADSILSQLTRRDQFGNADWFQIAFDPYQDGINGFGFFVTAAGVQADAKYSAFGEDFSWDAVWNSRVIRDDRGWHAELFIPYSAIRFPKRQVQTWNVNAVRLIRRTRQKSSWSTIDPQQDGFLNQFGRLEGIENIDSPFRLQLFPYTSAYYETSENGNATLLNGGMDIKYGLNDAFTLDMTLIPDFGQVQSDNQVLNLSPFEVRFNENRQFFTEGTELFNKGGLFYSRRVGGTPVNFSKPYGELQEGEHIIDNPTESKLINATKVSGRNNRGLGIGIFNGVTREMFATIEDSVGNRRKVQTDPLTNYNVFVLDKNLPNNSYFTLINTNVTRHGATYDANVIGFASRVRNKSNTWAISSGGAWNKKLAYTDGADNGYTYYVDLSKISGNLTYGGMFAVESDTYDPNDLGFLFNNNSVVSNVNVNYNMYEPKGIWNRLWAGAGASLSYLYKPRLFQSFGFGMNVGGFTRNFDAIGINAGISPVENVDHFESRQLGRPYNIPRNRNAGLFISTDYRDRLAFDINVNYTRFDELDRYNLFYRISPRFRVSDRLMLIYSYTKNCQNQNVGYALFNGRGSEAMANGGVADYNDDVIYFGRRNRTTYTQILTTTYNFTPVMDVSCRVRHYWSGVRYNEIVELGEDGYLKPTAYNGQDEDGISYHDNSFNAFNVDLVYTWVFSRGSELSLVWKNSILFSEDIPAENFNDNFGRVFDNPQVNSFSAKLLFFVDAYRVSRKFKKI